MADLTYIPVSELYPHPDNPRTTLGDLEELTASIQAKGILQNLTVVQGHAVSDEVWEKLPEEHRKQPPADEKDQTGRKESSLGYTVVIGHRRLAAAKRAGLTSVPCVIATMTHREQLQTMLLENMQRADLKIYEQAQCFQMLLDFGSTIDEIAAKTGFSATTIRRRVKMNELNQKKLKQVVDTRLISLADFDELAKIRDIKDRNEALDKIGTENFEYTVKSILRKQMVRLYLPEVKAALSALNAQALKASDTWDGRKYTTRGDYKIENWDEEKALFPKSADQNLYYVLNEDWGELTLYTKNKRVKPRTRSAEELEQEQDIADKWKYLTEQSGIFHNLRKDYIEKLSVTAKNKPLILHGALIAGTLSAATFNPINRKEYFPLLNMDGVYCGRETGIRALEALTTADPGIYPKLVWYLFSDIPEDCLVTAHNRKKEYPVYEPVPKLLFLYAWLKTLGYKLSTAEETLVYGTDEVYQKENASSNTAA